MLNSEKFSASGRKHIDKLSPGDDGENEVDFEYINNKRKLFKPFDLSPKPKSIYILGI